MARPPGARAGPKKPASGSATRPAALAGRIFGESPLGWESWLWPATPSVGQPTGAEDDSRLLEGEAEGRMEALTEMELTV